MDSNQAFATLVFLATRARQKGPPTPALSMPLRPCQPVSKCCPHLTKELGAAGSSNKVIRQLYVCQARTVRALSNQMEAQGKFYGKAIRSALQVEAQILFVGAL